MYQHILVATDGSDLVEKAVDHAVALAAFHQALLTIVTVTNVWPSDGSLTERIEKSLINSSVDFDEIGAETARDVLNSATDKASKRSVESRTVHVTNTPPAQAIVQTAAEKDYDLIVMASHGWRGVRRMILGSQSW
jgi:nucleotide-binding universal stress UspA family protein